VVSCNLQPLEPRKLAGFHWEKVHTSSALFIFCLKRHLFQISHVRGKFKISLVQKWLSSVYFPPFFKNNSGAAEPASLLHRNQGNYRRFCTYLCFSSRGQPRAPRHTTSSSQIKCFFSTEPPLCLPIYNIICANFHPFFLGENP